MKTLVSFCYGFIILIGYVLLVPPAKAQEARGVGIPAATPAGRYYALVIGNNAYTSVPKLKTAEADAREVAALLRDSYGFETKLLLNATRQQIMSAFTSYRRTLAPDASLLIYYAGHGINDKDADKAYWLPVDATLDDQSNWIIADEITTALKVIPARHVLVISDSCYSGTLTRGLSDSLPRPTEREQFLQRMAAGRSRTLMASGGDEPVADGGGGGHSIFAGALLRGLKEMDKGQFTASELFRYHVQEPVAGRANQTPEYNPLRNSGHESGDFIFERVKAGDKTAEVKATANPPDSSRAPGIAKLNATVTALRFYLPKPNDERIYRTRFPRSEVSFVNWELELGFPDPRREVPLVVDGVLYRADGSVDIKGTAKGVIQPGWTSVTIIHGWGYQEAGKWPIETYRVELFIEGQKIATGSFEVY
ncbi:MAG TPA: caspase family protein [Pyrinomonadaceae bacterium]|nr:caspase family protein [Pyrinomonadaceae bacterium]